MEFQTSSMSAKTLSCRLWVHAFATSAFTFVKRGLTTSLALQCGNPYRQSLDAVLSHKQGGIRRGGFLQIPREAFYVSRGFLNVHPEPDDFTVFIIAIVSIATRVRKR